MKLPLKRDDFPQGIRAVTAADLPALNARLNPGRDGNSTDIRYARLSGQLAFLTGHEYAHDREGRPYTRQEWEDVFHKCLSHLNDELLLGLDDEVINVLTLCYTVLQETVRYGDDPMIGSVQGENTAVHSLHTLPQALYVYQSALEEYPALARDADFFRNFQMTCLLMAVHDLGEMLGEAGSVSNAAEAGTFKVKDKTEYERMVFNFGVRLAIQTVTEKKDKKEFYKAVDAVKALTNVQNRGMIMSDEQMAHELASHLKDEISLRPRGEKLFSFLRSSWEWIEAPEKSPHPFLGYLATVCERIQGTRHLNRHVKNTFSPVKKGSNVILMTTSSLIPSYRTMTDAEYEEGRLGHLCAAVDRGSLAELAVAEKAVARTYRTRIGFMINTAKAFFLDPSIEETRLHKDGTPYTLEEAKKRTREIALAGRIARLEGGALRFYAQQQLAGSFNAKALYTGWTAMTSSQAVSMYERAIRTKYLPALIDRGDGRMVGEVLSRDRPAALTGAPDFPLQEKENVEHAVRQILDELRLRA